MPKTAEELIAWLNSSEGQAEMQASTQEAEEGTELYQTTAFDYESGVMDQRITI